MQPLYGRAAIVAQARASIERALAGEGRPLVFTGEPGIGKSTLAEHVAGEAAARQAAVAWGRCWEAGGAPPYLPWIQVFRGLGMDEDPFAGAMAGWSCRSGNERPARVGSGMAKPKLTYFDAPVSRGEECRLALSLAGVDFEDNRVKAGDWPAIKPTTPYGSMPIFEVPGHPPLAQSNAILVLIGRKHDLHPSEPFEAARHESMMAYVEDLRHAVGPTLRMRDEAEKKKAREALAADVLPVWAANVEKQLGDGPFFAGAKLHVVDLKLHMAVRWFKGGKVDYVPATIFDGHPRLMRLFEAVRDHAGVQAWYQKA